MNEKKYKKVKNDTEKELQIHQNTYLHIYKHKHKHTKKHKKYMGININLNKTSLITRIETQIMQQKHTEKLKMKYTLTTKRQTHTLTET